MTMPPFHLAFPVDDLQAARAFYGGILGCREGRSSESWIDFDFYGHQIVAHLAPEELGETARNAVDGHAVPARHFGVVLPWGQWEALAERCEKARLTFIIAPYVRFKGKAGEQGTFFVTDPAGNALEFKTFRNMDQLFAV